MPAYLGFVIIPSLFLAVTTSIYLVASMPGMFSPFRSVAVVLGTSVTLPFLFLAIQQSHDSAYIVECYSYGDAFFYGIPFSVPLSVGSYILVDLVSELMSKPPGKKP